MKIKTTRLIVHSCLLFGLCMLVVDLYGQKKETSLKKIYLHADAGITNFDGGFGELGVQAIFKHNWVATVSYQTIDMEAKNLPADYDPGFSIINVLFGDGNPTTTMNVVNVMGGKCFESGRRIWFTTEAGLSVGSGDKLNFSSQPAGTIDYVSSANYSVRKEKVTTVGLVLKADFNWAFCPFLGLGAGVFANLNSLQSPVGFRIKLIGGWMNLKPKTNKS
jgi:hypothetical protein